jgi:protease IV
MVKYLLGVLSGIVLVVMLVVIAALIFTTLQSAEPGIANDSVLSVDLSGPIPEHVAVDFSLDFLDHGVPPTVLEMHNLFQKAAADKRIRAITLYCHDLEVGWARAQEIRSDIEEFRKSGKPVLALIAGGDSIDYYVASAADEVYLLPESLLDVRGLRAEVSFFKDTLSKLGIEAEMENIGKYKSAVEPYSRTGMSDAFREVTNSILDELYGQFLEGTGKSRGKTVDQMKEIVDQGPFMSQQALDAGLVDGLLYEDEFRDKVKEKIGVDELTEVEQNRYRKVSMDSLGLSGKNKVAVVYAVGAIMQGDSDTDPVFGDSVLGSDSFNKTLERVREDDDVKAVILRIDSPGGDAFASDEMWREMQLLQESKPLVISMSDVAASGGYYLAMAKAPLVAYPGTYTGSIGVFFGKLNLRGFYDKIGLKKEILTRGQYADIYTDYRSLTDAERTKLREGIESTYRTFVQKVADARGQAWDQVHEVAQGRVWLGTQAQRHGLIDEIGGFDKAIEIAKDKAGLKEADKIRLVTYPAPKRFIDLLFNRESMVQSARLRTFLRAHLGDMTSWPALLEGGMLRLTPYTITVR